MKPSDLLEMKVRLEDAASRRGFCGPDCTMTILGDITDDWGERTILGRCERHGLKLHSFVTARGRPGMLGLDSPRGI